LGVDGIDQIGSNQLDGDEISVGEDEFSGVQDTAFHNDKKYLGK
jgi:hypothetical protein